jgi:hypothetical protein
MPEEKQATIVLGEFELVGKITVGDLTELIFKPSFVAGPLDPMLFSKQGNSTITIRDRKMAKSIHNEDRFRIVLERIPNGG